MKKIITAVLTTALCFGLTAGTAIAATISDTGPGSTNTVTVDNDTDCSVTNNNNVDVNNSNDQDADSGNSGTTDNTSGGNATSGDASNQNGTSTNVNINNGGCAPAEVSTTPTPTTPTTPSTTPVGGAVLSASTATLPETGSALTTTILLSLVAMTTGTLLLAVPAIRKNL